MKKLLSLLVAVILLTSVFSGCKQTAQQPVTLVFAKSDAV